MQLNISYQDVSEDIISSTVPRDFVFQDIGIDSRASFISSNKTFIAIKGDQYDGHDFVHDALDAGFSSFVVDNKDVYELLKLKNQLVFLVRNTLRFIQFLARKHRLKFNIPVVGITGSNGKTICKEWIYQLLTPEYRIHRSPKSYNSQIGVALSLLELNEKHELAIIEAGISKKGEMSSLREMIQPTIGLMTNNLSAHLEAFKDLEEKNTEKHLLFQGTETVVENEVTAINNALAWSYRDVKLMPDDNGTKIEIGNHKFTIPFYGAIEIENAINSFLVALKFTKNELLLEKRMSDLKLLSNRWEQFTGVNNNLVVNDSYSLDLGSLKVSLEQCAQISQNRRKVLFLGVANDSIPMLKEYIALAEEYQTDRIVIVTQSPIEECYLTPNIVNYTDLLSFQLSDDLFHNALVLFKASRSFSLAPIVNLFKQNNHRTRFEINLESIRSNLLYYKSIAETKTKLLVMVKASSYGAGLSEMSQFLQSSNVDYLGVAFTQEGIELRKNNVDLPVIVMNPDEAYFDQAIEMDLEPSVYSLQHLDEIIKVLIDSGQKNYPIHLKIDTGMNRLGFHQDEVEPLIDAIKSQPEVHVKSIFTHFSVADDPNFDDFTEKQFNRFVEIADKIELELGYRIQKHCCNSNAALRFPNYHLDMIRVGIGIHGVNVNNLNLTPSLSLYSYISQIRALKKGEIVGYGNRYLADRDTLIGVVPIGYADGITRSFGTNGGYVFINQGKAKVIGNVCMDMLMVDLSECINVSVGDKVEVFGKNISIEEHAKFQQTIAYEIACKISDRIPRVYIK